MNELKILKKCKSGYFDEVIFEVCYLYLKKYMFVEIVCELGFNFVCFVYYWVEKYNWCNLIGE